MDKGLEKLLNELNPKQRLAASMQEKSALIIAGAGSGKTKVLTSRIAFLIKEQNVASNSIMAVTFTNKAAKEMVERLELIGINTKGMWVGTFHGICNKILRKFYSKTHLPAGFQILDTDDGKAIVKRIYKQNGWDEKADDTGILKSKDVYNFIMSQKEAGVRAHQYVSPKGASWKEEEFKLRVFEQYEEQIKQEGAVDFPELLLLVVELFEKDDFVRTWVQNTFKHVLIDEFQDTNNLQYRWLKILTGQKNAVFAVGDDDQCLASGTSVLMESGGQKVIESIAVGDRVWCSNGDAMTSARVLRVNKNKKKVLGIYLHNGAVLRSTREHIHLKVQNPTERHYGMHLQMIMNANLAGHALRVVGFDNIQRRQLGAQGFAVYSQGVDWVAEHVSKSMGELEEMCERLAKELGLKQLRTTKILGQQLRNTRADELCEGDLLLGVNGNNLKIIKIEEQEEVDVYDLDVEGYHNFVANGVFTHNSIYGFRGAQVKNMQHFLMDFNVKDEHMVRLEQNYRSDGNILKAANSLIEKNSDRLGKNLWTSSGDGELIEVKKCYSESDEANYVTSKVLELKSRGIELNEIAFLYRVNAQSRVLEQSLLQKSIKYVIYGGLRFFERAEIKNAMGYLRLSANTRDDSALLRVINLPSRGIGSKSIEKLLATSKQNGCSLWQSVQEAANAAGASSGIKEFVKIIEKLRQAHEEKSLEEVVRLCIEQSCLIAMYRAENENERIENLQELISAAKSFSEEALEEENNLESFLAHCALQSAVDGDETDEQAVQLMTVHASKGLEFKHVFLIGLEEGLFPHTYNSDKSNEEIAKKDLEEERRLMYVALTRAKKTLSISYTQERNMFGNTIRNAPSRFLAEIPTSIVKRLSSSYFEKESDEEEEPLFLSSSKRGAIVSVKDRFGINSKAGGSGRVQSIFQSVSVDGHKSGDWVKHNKFGRGQVKRVIGSGEDASIEIDFEDYGRRCLLIKFAKLEKV